MQTIDASFRLGIRFIDTAILHKNHKQIANVLAQLMLKHKLARDHWQNPSS
jgi:diketogulonate reductase-like aldo/keto reductase